MAGLGRLRVFTSFNDSVVTFVTPRIQESQSWNHEWSWEGPLELLQSNLPAQVGSLEHFAQDCVQTAFEYLQERRLQRLSGQPVPVPTP